MSLSSAVLAVSVPAILMSVFGTTVTILCIWYRKKISSTYFTLREYWHENRTHLPDWLILFLQVFLGVFGISLVFLGFILMPLPGPGTVIVIAGAGILDLEFGWIIPVLKKIFSWCPDQWQPDSLNQGLEELQTNG